MDANHQLQSHHRPWESSDGEDQHFPAVNGPDNGRESQTAAVPTPMKRACNECRQQKVRGNSLLYIEDISGSLADISTA